MKRDYIFYTRILILIFSLISVIAGVGEGEVALALVLLMLLASNVQLRTIITKDAFYLLSLLVDLGLVYLIHESYGGLTYIALYITLLDSIVYSRSYRIGAVLLSSVGLLYFASMAAAEVKLILALAYAVIFAYGLAYRHMSSKLQEIEYLYDDVRKYSYELENAKKQIEAFSQQVEGLTLVKERQRISEEIHDTIGHRLTALLMQLEAGVRLLDAGSFDGRELLGQAVENLRESIDVLRQTVRSMKPREYRNLIYSIEELLKRFKKETGISVELSVTGAAVRLLPGIEMVLYKNLQEAVTNSVRHGKAKAIAVYLIYEASGVSLAIEDDGIGCMEIKKGMGISAMEERLKFVGGSLSISSDKGFRVTSKIPVRGEEQ